jgi:hypothetical protein
MSVALVNRAADAIGGAKRTLLTTAKHRRRGNFHDKHGLQPALLNHQRLVRFLPVN